ncbi:hypothetical protein [Leptospira stimsonii]|nr:hypothetical protein [Leptospira stimsonii]
MSSGLKCYPYPIQNASFGPKHSPFEEWLRSIVFSKVKTLGS